MGHKKIIFGVVILVVLVGFSDPDNRFQYIFNRLEKYIKEESPEKIYLHTDKQIYTSGETIWMKSYLVNGVSHTTSNKSKVSYVELINAKDSIIARRTLYTDSLGASVDIKTDANWDSGKYLLRSYTNYMRNDKPVFFQKEILIWQQKIKEEEVYQTEDPTVTLPDSLLLASQQIDLKTIKPKIKFYPEGGYLISNLKNGLGILATDTYGNGIPVIGGIKDDKGNKVTFFRTYAYGLGKIAFKPEIGKNYTAYITINDKEFEYPFPSVVQEGYRLGVKNNQDHIVLDVETTTKEGLNGTLLIGHLRGNMFFKHIESDIKNAYSIKILTKELDDGVAHFTLFKPNGEAVCERLTFVNNPKNDVALEINTNKKRYYNREEVLIDLSISDKEGNAIKGDFSMSVVGSDSIDKVAATSDIRSWLLLDSDLKGTIENPGYFFENDVKNNRKYLLDALMLTHGWRRFVWKEFLQHDANKDKFLAEKGLFVTGKTTVFDKPFATKPSLTKLSFLKKGEVYQEKSSTNDQGRFRYGPFVFKDTISAVVEAAFPNVKNKNRKKNISIFIDAPPSGAKVVRYDKKKNNLINYEYLKQYLTEVKRKQISDFKYNPDATILDEVLLKTKRKTLADKLRDEIDEITLYQEPSNRLFPDSIPGAGSQNVVDLLRQVPGVNVFGVFPDQKIEIRGGGLGSSAITSTVNANSPQSQQGALVSPLSSTSAPLFLVDGAEVSIDFISQMLASEVSFVDVLKGNETVVFGSRGINGVIAIYTYRGFSFSQRQVRSPGVTNFEFPGFYKAREFFTPDYSTKKPEHFIPDYRTTLFWKPDIFIESDTVSKLKFYTSDNIGEYLIKVEGITTDGRIVKVTKEIHIDD